MLPNAFIGKKSKPTARELSAALGPSHALWQEIIEALNLTPEWNSYSPKAGWSLKLKQKSRTILYLSPCPGSFRIAFILGAKALTAAKASDLPKSAQKLLAEAKKYPEGSAVRFEEVTAVDLPSISTLAQIKKAH